MHNLGFSFKNIVDSAHDIVIVTKASPIDPPGPEIVYVNRAFTELTGYSAEEMIGKNPRVLQFNETDPATTSKIRSALLAQQPVRTSIRNISKTGRAYWLDLSIIPLRNDAGELTHFAAIERDVTAEKEHASKLARLSTTDHLTELLNKRAFDQVLREHFAKFQRKLADYSILYMDIDHFKSINDTYGHDRGDAALQAVAEVCAGFLRPYDILARLGGEEFGVLLPDVNESLAVSIAERLRHAIGEVTVEGQLGFVRITVSVGVSGPRQGDADGFDALKRADSALYAAKEAGRNCVCSAP